MSETIRKLQTTEITQDYFIRDGELYKTQFSSCSNAKYSGTRNPPIVLDLHKEIYG